MTKKSSIVEGIRTTVYLDKEYLDIARELGINVSEALRNALVMLIEQRKIELAAIAENGAAAQAILDRVNHRNGVGTESATDVTVSLT